MTQTMPPPATKTGMMTRDLEIAHTKNLVMARIGALTQGAGIEVWMLQNFIRSLGANRDTLSRMHEARLLIECINASVRYREPIHFRIEPLGNRLIGEIEEGYAAYADLSTIPAQHRGSYVFPSLYGEGQNRLRSITMPSEPQSVSVRSRRQQPMQIARQGPIPNLDPPAAPPIMPATPPPESEQRFTTPSWCARHIVMLHQKVNQLQQLQHAVQP